jgi:molybdenum cofactor synthesis domain-containing protein
MDPKVHPMVAVPDAIRAVIRETARVLVEQGQLPPETISSDATWRDILHRVLDKDVTMNEPGYPPYNASIMDGYAIRTREFKAAAAAEGSEWTHQVIDKVYAGDGSAPKQDTSSDLPAAYYITTGAVVPGTFDRVVPIEECKVSPDCFQIAIQSTATISNGQWIRGIGCDITAGSVVLPRGHVMDPVALGLLKQSGANSIQVKRPIAVGVLSTGNELILGAKDATKPGQIPDVNRPILLSLLSTFGNCNPIDLGQKRDDNIESMARTIDEASKECDVIITTGGVSMGETDIVKQVLVDHCGGTLHFGRMHMKPGKPTTFVSITRDEKTTLVFAMPGNPVSATVCTQLLVKPCLDLLFAGDSTANMQEKTIEERLNHLVEHAVTHAEVRATLAHDVKLDGQRPEYHRVVLEKLPDGSFEVSTTGVQQSSRLMSLRDARGLLVLPYAVHGKTKALKGEIYPVLVLSGGGGVKQGPLRDSLHLNKQTAPKGHRIAVVEVVMEGVEKQSSLDLICERVQSALSGSKSGSATIVSKKLYSGPREDLYNFAIDSNKADFIVVSCASFEGSFQYHLAVSSALRRRLSKVADTMALQARQGAASQDPTSALFEAVVGYAPEERGAMLICLSDRGIDGGVANIRGLLKHALNVGRGKEHNRHHTHQRH